MELANFIVEAVLKNAVTDKIVIYGGRFQPFHAGHKKVYDALVSKFGSKNVYIATSDIQDSDKSPLSFNEKKEIATKLFGIPSSKFVKVKSPYQPVEILRGFDDTTTGLIIAVGEKDDSRLGGAYFKPYKGDAKMKPYGVEAYVYTQLPSNSFGATDVRNMFRNKRLGDKRKEAEFTKFFGKFDKTIYNKLDKKLNEGVDTDNKIPGGKADNLSLEDIAKKWAGDYYDYKNVLKTVKEQLKAGIKSEMEHTSDVRIAAEIAKDHIWEKLTYYKDLQQIEKGMYQPHNPVKEDNPNYENDSDDLENIYNTEFSDPSTGRKMRIKDALRLDPQDFAHQEAMRLLRVMLAQKHRQVPGNIGKGQQSPKTDKPKQVNLSLYAAGYGEGVDLDEASATGSGYDEKTLDQLVDNPETGEKVKVRSALNYDKNHPAYKAAIALVRNTNSKLPQKKVGGQKHPVAVKPPQTKQVPNASEPISIAKRFGHATQNGANTQNGTHSTNKTQKPLEKPLSGPNSTDRPVEPKQPVKGLQPTSSIEKDTTDKSNAGAKQNPKVTGKIIKHNISKLSPNEQKIFKTGQHKANSPLRSYIGKSLNNTMQNIVPNVKQEMEHLGHTYQFAGEGLASLFDGKPVSDNGKDAIKKMAQVLSVNSIKSIDNKDRNSKVLMQHLGKHLAAHIADDIITNGIGKVAQNAGTELDGDNDKFIEWFGLYFAQQMKDGEIPMDVWDSALQDYHKDKEDGKLDGDTNTVQNEIIAELSDSGDIGLGMSFGDYDANMGDYVGGNMTVSDITANANSANSTTGTEHNGTWNEFDNQNYYTDKLPGWQVIGHLSNTLPDEVKQRTLPIFNHNGDENGQAAHTIQKITAPNEQIYEGKEINEMSTNDIHFKNIIEKYKKGNFTIRKKIAMAAVGKYNASINDIARELRNMGYKEITDVEKEAGIEIDEDINVKVDKGDDVLMGKFKNKRVTIKDIGKDQHGMPTINGHQATTFRKVEEGIINEGGAYGHMNHPFDVRMNLSFGDLKAIVNNALDGNLGVVREKTDGQALAISWKNGRLISARNKGHLANAGANAMDINAVATKFGGRGGLTDAYNFAMKDLENAIRGLSQAQKDKIFKEGKVFVNLEVIWPTSVNVIPYNQALLVFHNAVEYNDAGNPIGKVDGAESVLGGMLKQINAHVQSAYTIQGPPIVTLPKNKTLSSQKGKFNGMISKLQSEFGLTDKDGVADYHQAWWDNFISKSKKKISSLERAGLIKRWAFDDKSLRIGDIKDVTAREWAEGIDKGPKTTIMSGNLRKFEDIFLGVGAEVLSFMGSVLTAQPDKALQAMRKELETTADQIMSGGTITQIKKLEKELSRLNAIGGFDKIVPSEGIVFQYKGNAYKLTGAFAPLNQILGIFKFSR